MINLLHCWLHTVVDPFDFDKDPNVSLDRKLNPFFLENLEFSVFVLLLECILVFLMIFHTFCSFDFFPHMFLKERTRYLFLVVWLRYHLR